MEFLDEESRPRFLFQSRSRPPNSQTPETHHLHKPSLFISFSFSTLLFLLSFFFLQSEPYKSLLFWLSLSLLLGPLAPSSHTGGSILVGSGKLLLPLSPPPTPSPDPKSNRRSRSRKPEDQQTLDQETLDPTPILVEKRVEKNRVDSKEFEEEEREWSEGDLELLKKLIVKNPVGKPRRWEVIAEAFQGRYGVESVIKMSKSMGEKKMSDSDSYARFLKDRKAVDKRVLEEIENGEVRRENGGEEVSSWSSGDDIALLNALKAFPKEAAMRWEKIAAAVPGKTKAACAKRVTELKKGFRTSKASAES